jgi:chromosome segregation ATPase
LLTYVQAQPVINGSVVSLRSVSNHKRGVYNDGYAQVDSISGALEADRTAYEQRLHQLQTTLLERNQELNLTVTELARVNSASQQQTEYLAQLEAQLKQLNEENTALEAYKQQISNLSGQITHAKSTITRLVITTSSKV